MQPTPKHNTARTPPSSLAQNAPKTKQRKRREDSTTLDRARAAATPESAAWAARAAAARTLYVVPKGSNDDWYFLYAALAARVRTARTVDCGL